MRVKNELANPAHLSTMCPTLGIFKLCSLNEHYREVYHTYEVGLQRFLLMWKPYRVSTYSNPFTYTYHVYGRAFTYMKLIGGILFTILFLWSMRND